jgi:leucyl/phenylalanyl-tRNA--protein transferase
MADPSSLPPPLPPRFIDPRRSGPEGVVGIGGGLSPATLRAAYRRGIFPWPVEGLPLLWFCPPERAVLDFTRLHVARRLARARRASRLTFTIDRAFDDVIAACRDAPRPGQRGTWITRAMLEAYRALHRAGGAHSVEAWDESGALVGGIYGVDVDGAFAGESMFHAVSDASKLALLYLVDHLRSRGLDWMDIQMTTTVTESLGAVYVPRDAFLERLRETRARGLVLFDPVSPAASTS